MSTSQALIPYTPPLQEECPICYIVVYHEAFWKRQACQRHGICLPCHEQCRNFGLYRCPLCRAWDLPSSLGSFYPWNSENMYVHLVSEQDSDVPLEPLYISIAPTRPREPTSYISLEGEEIIFVSQDGERFLVRDTLQRLQDRIQTWEHDDELFYLEQATHRLRDRIRALEQKQHTLWWYQLLCGVMFSIVLYQSFSFVLSI